MPSLGLRQGVFDGSGKSCRALYQKTDAMDDGDDVGIDKQKTMTRQEGMLLIVVQPFSNHANHLITHVEWQR